MPSQSFRPYTSTARYSPPRDFIDYGFIFHLSRSGFSQTLWHPTASGPLPLPFLLLGTPHLRCPHDSPLLPGVFAPIPLSHTDLSSSSCFLSLWHFCSRVRGCSPEHSSPLDIVLSIHTEQVLQGQMSVTNYSSPSFPSSCSPPSTQPSSHSSKRVRTPTVGSTKSGMSS